MKDQLEWDPDLDAAQRAARVVALRALDAVADARDAIRKRDVESIHEFRVALRRVRSWTRAYHTALDDTVRDRTIRSLRRIALATTRLRDLDVQIEWLRSETSALGESRLEAAKWVTSSLKSERKKVWRRFRKILEREYSGAERALRDQLTHYLVRYDIRTRNNGPTMRDVTSQLLEDQGVAFSKALAR
ncbi:MAG TPA: CHAD domain-containing protein, partial [Gemmatimonadaceae bacterium]